MPFALWSRRDVWIRIQSTPTTVLSSPETLKSTRPTQRDRGDVHGTQREHYFRDSCLSCCGPISSRRHHSSFVLSQERRHDLGPLLSEAARHRKPYREVEVEDLNRQGKSVHHEGVVVVCEPKATIPFGRFIGQLKKPAVLMALDNVTNPHNQGAILRSLGWFGGAALVVNDPAPNVNTAAMRISRRWGVYSRRPYVKSCKGIERIRSQRLSNHCSRSKREWRMGTCAARERLFCHGK